MTRILIAAALLALPASALAQDGELELEAGEQTLIDAPLAEEARIMSLTLEVNELEQLDLATVRAAVVADAGEDTANRLLEELDPDGDGIIDRYELEAAGFDIAEWGEGEMTFEAIVE